MKDTNSPKTLIYTFEDHVTPELIMSIEGEVIDFDDGDPPEVYVSHVSVGKIDFPLSCFSQHIMKHWRDMVFQEWVKDVK